MSADYRLLSGTRKPSYDPSSYKCDLCYEYRRLITYDIRFTKAAISRHLGADTYLTACMCPLCHSISPWSWVRAYIEELE